MLFAASGLIGQGQIAAALPDDQSFSAHQVWIADFRSSRSNDEISLPN
jgi:hypothetical protein